MVGMSGSRTSIKSGGSLVYLSWVGTGGLVTIVQTVVVWGNVRVIVGTLD